MFCVSMVSGGIGTFGPIIIQEFGFTSFQTILLNIPNGAIQVFAIMGSAFLATRIKLKSPVLALLTVISLIGAILIRFIARNQNNKGPLLLAYYLTTFFAGITPIIYSWLGQNTAGETKKKTTNAFMFIGQNTGNIVGPLLYKSSEAPLYRTGLTANMCLFAVIIVFTIGAVIHIKFLMKKQRQKRIEMGKPADQVDFSMMRRDVDQVDEHYVDNSLLDMTDLHNEDFIYVL